MDGKRDLVAELLSEAQASNAAHADEDEEEHHHHHHDHDEDGHECCHHHHDHDDDDDDDDDAMYECVCPNCGDTIMLGENIIADGSIECPNCGESLEFDFSEIEDEDNED